MGLLRDLNLRFRAAQRVGAFSHATKRGMPPEAAHAYSDQLYPPTAADLEFEAALRNGTVTPLPIASAVSLLYPIAAAIYIAGTPASDSAVAGYALANLGYVLLAAGFFKGTFRVFGLRKRFHAFVAAAVFVVAGVVLSNAPPFPP